MAHKNGKLQHRRPPHHHHLAFALPCFCFALPFALPLPSAFPLAFALPLAFDSALCLERNPTTRLQAARTRAWLVLPHARWATTWLQAARTRAWLVLPHAGPRHGCKQLGPGPGWSSHTPDGMRQVSGADHGQIPLCCEKFLELTMVRSCCSQDEVLFWALLKLDTDSHSHLWG